MKIIDWMAGKYQEIWSGVERGFGKKSVNGGFEIKLSKVDSRIFSS
ncbi:hypothetical protein [Salipaludibacillus neizhouensis]|nr:hypothetical protein [Salipaludibacillus neizhouensis]